MCALAWVYRDLGCGRGPSISSWGGEEPVTLFRVESEGRGEAALSSHHSKMG